MTWNWVDVVVLIVATRAMLTGVHVGLSIGVGKVTSLLVTYYCMLRYYPKLAGLVEEVTRLSMQWAVVVAMALIAVGAMIGVWFLFKGLGKMMSLDFESRLSTLGGGLSGLAYGLLKCSIFIFILFFIPNSFVKGQVYSKSWWGKRSVNQTVRWYKKAGKYIPGSSEYSMRGLRAHVLREKDHMAHDRRVAGEKGETPSGATIGEKLGSLVRDLKADQPEADPGIPDESAYTKLLQDLDSELEEGAGSYGGPEGGPPEGPR